MINADNLIISKGESLFFFFNISPMYFVYAAESDSFLVVTFDLEDELLALN